MTPEARQRRLESLVREARGRSAQRRAELERRKNQPACPGDLFVLAATADLPVEWAILDRDSGSGDLLAVPADAHPLVGSADVAIEPDGSLVLRCRFGVWLSAAVFKTDLRTGVLPEKIVTAARHRWRQLEQGDAAASPLAEEINAEPEYRDWIRDVPERARALALRSQTAAPPAGSSAWPLQLAAVLALATIGLAVWVVRLHLELERLTEAEPVVISAQVVLGDETRGEIVLAVPREAKSIVLPLVVDPAIDLREGYLKVVHREGRTVYESRQRFPPEGEFGLLLPRSLLPDGLYLIQLYPEAGFGARPLATERLRVETGE